MKKSLLTLAAVILLAQANDTLAQCCCVPHVMQPTQIVPIQPYSCQPTPVVFAAPAVDYSGYSVTMPTQMSFVVTTPFESVITNTIAAPAVVYGAPLPPVQTVSGPVLRSVPGPVLRSVPATGTVVRSANTTRTIQDGLIRTASHTSPAPTPTVMYTCRKGVKCSTGQCEVVEGVSFISQADARAKLQGKISQIAAACSGTISYRDVLEVVDLSGSVSYECGILSTTATGTCSTSF